MAIYHPPKDDVHANMHSFQYSASKPLSAELFGHGSLSPTAQTAQDVKLL